MPPNALSLVPLTPAPVSVPPTLALAEAAWPLPPGFVLGSTEQAIAEEACELLLRSGDLHIGRLKALKPERRQVVIQHRGESAETTFSYEHVKLLRLPRRIRIAEGSARAYLGDIALSPVADSCTFALMFADGQVRSGDTTGHVRQDGGVYLFPGDNPEQVERWFIPLEAISSFTLGSLTGELLVQESFVSEEHVSEALEIQREMRERPLGEYLLDQQVLTPEDLSRALELQKSTPMMRLGDALQQLGMINQAQLDDALSRQRAQRHRPLGEILVDMGVVDEDQIRHVLARKLGIPYVDVRHFPSELDALKSVPAAFAMRNNILPLHKRDQELSVAMADPLNQSVNQELRAMTGLWVLPVVASADAISARVQQYYGNGGAGLRKLEEVAGEQSDAFPFHEKASPKAEELATRLFEEGSSLELAKDESAQHGNDGENTLVQFVNKMIADARAAGVSDIHIETYPGRQNTRVRFRRDGVMSDYLEVPYGSRSALISRIKVMAALDISERRKPQDGKIEISIPGSTRAELRVATIPTTNNLEDVVMRLLGAPEAIPMNKLGLEADTLASLAELAGKAHGLLLVCGPTGSGKTTTLHSLLGHINTTERKIWTAEDPIEITQPGLRQVQMNAKIGWTFAAAMRTFLRADPDVIMVGEMRDEETTRTAIEASLTGHLVLSTLHTNSAPESVTRLLDLGMDPFNFADALLGVLSQRLVRKLCPNCREVYAPSRQELFSLAEEYCLHSGLQPQAVLDQWQQNHPDGIRLARARERGCTLCQGSGYRGRAGIHELLVNSPALKSLIQSRTPVADLSARAIAEGMRTLKQDGIVKVLTGVTDILQVRAACN